MLASRVFRSCTRRLCIHAAAAAPPGTATAAVHADALLLDRVRHTTDMDVAPPLSLSTTFSCPADDSDGHVYARLSNPTRERAEALLGAIESTADSDPAHAVLYSSGLAAVFAVLARLRPPRVAIAGGYHGTHQVLAQLQRISGGAICAPVPLPPPAEVGAALRGGDVLWLETPRNPDCAVADIAAYAAAARAVRGGGARVVVDGTFAPPPLQYPLTLGADVVMHSTTKSLSGHSDAVGGALCTQDADLAADLRSASTRASAASLAPSSALASSAAFFFAATAASACAS